MARAPFIIFERKIAAGRVFMARFYDTAGKIVKTKTFPDVKSAGAAARKAEGLLKNGIIANAANPDAATDPPRVCRSLCYVSPAPTARPSRPA